MIYKSRTAMVKAWTEAADAKLKADDIDPEDDAAVKDCLCATVGGVRLYEFWKEVVSDDRQAS